MKILFVRSNTHIKNFNFIRKCKTINFYIIESINAINNIDLNTFDAVFSPCDNVTRMNPDTKQFYTYPVANPPTCDGCILQQ